MKHSCLKDTKGNENYHPPLSPIPSREGKLLNFPLPVCLPVRCTQTGERVRVRGDFQVKRALGMIVGIFMLSLTQIVFAQMGHDMPAGESKVVDGVEARLKVAPSQSMVDVELTHAKTGKVIMKAKVLTKIKGPDGKIQEKELLGMKMGEVFSYMNTLDISKKGSYSFDIIVELEKKKVKFNFVHEVK